ncbi:hypothetical protein H671_8g19362 [Cricetulus griseus]|uniref:Uncharacterized protein n=1 Tax=Cricetulus griseus TaxID=10029 RepID=A0A061I056_CRIGR|nr:hypothetical protein H671_8g19362 [Cricetulus griseus]
MGVGGCSPAEEADNPLEQWTGGHKGRLGALQAHPLPHQGLDNRITCQLNKVPNLDSGFVDLGSFAPQQSHSPSPRKVKKLKAGTWRHMNNVSNSSISSAVLKDMTSYVRNDVQLPELNFALLGALKRQGFSVVLEAVLELALVDQAGLELTEIRLPLPPEC